MSVGDGPTLLGQTLDLIAALKLKEALDEPNSSSSDRTIDGSAVVRTTTPRVQILVAVAQTGVARGGRFTVDGVSEAFEAAFLELRLGALFQAWSPAK